jgi:hypothetical protein
VDPPPPPSHTKWTRLVHPSVLTGHVWPPRWMGQYYESERDFPAALRFYARAEDFAAQARRPALAVPRGLIVISETLSSTTVFEPACSLWFAAVGAQRAPPPPPFPPIQSGHVSSIPPY